jgi:Na+/H+ antiporter NhaD/arsenite permease-like protein
MLYIVGVIFLVGYFLITAEHYFRINKSITATALAAVLWGLVAMIGYDHHLIEQAIHHLSAEVFALVAFLLAAMTLVEILVHYRFFDWLRLKLFSLGLQDASQLVLMATLAFCFSAVIDNLTTTIVMVQIARRFFKGRNLLVAVSAIVVAANAGGAFSPVGDVTTIMLWLAGKFTASEIIVWAFLPSLTILVVSTMLFLRQIQGDTPDERPVTHEKVMMTTSEKTVIAATFISFTFPPLAHFFGLPPFMGLLCGVGMVGLLVGWYANTLPKRESHLAMDIEKLIGKVDLTSLLFFIGILFSVGALGFLGILDQISNVVFGDTPAFSRLVAGSILLGIISAIFDNIPLTAAAIDVMPTSNFHLWVLLAICVGTGGSLLVIGSAAGVVAMGMIKDLTFKDYLKIATIPAAVGYFSAIAVWYIQFILFA